MAENSRNTALRLLQERFGHDSLIALATLDDGRPCVRTVNAVYDEGAFYIVTHALSGKMRQLARNPQAAVCGEWFTGHGIGENLGHVLAPENAARMTMLRSAFASWYDNGHTDESDPNTCLLRIRLTDAVLADHGTWYTLSFPVDRT